MKILPDGTVALGTVPAGAKLLNWTRFGDMILLATDQGLFIWHKGELRPAAPDPAAERPRAYFERLWFFRGRRG